MLSRSTPFAFLRCKCENILLTPFAFLDPFRVPLTPFAFLLLTPFAFLDPFRVPFAFVAAASAGDNPFRWRDAGRVWTRSLGNRVARASAFPNGCPFFPDSFSTRAFAILSGEPQTKYVLAIPDCPIYFPTMVGSNKSHRFPPLWDMTVAAYRRGRDRHQIIHRVSIVRSHLPMRRELLQRGVVIVLGGSE